MNLILPLALLYSQARSRAKFNLYLPLHWRTRHAPYQHVPKSHRINALSWWQSDGYTGGIGYFAGMGDGLVTVAGRGAARPVWVIALRYPKIIRATWSRPDGRYYIGGLNPHERYLVLARDHHGDYAPYAWDNLTPATDLTPAEQSAFYQELGFKRV